MKKTTQNPTFISLLLLLNALAAAAQGTTFETAPPIVSSHWLEEEAPPRIPTEDYLLFTYIHTLEGFTYSSAVAALSPLAPKLSLVGMLFRKWQAAKIAADWGRYPKSYLALDYENLTRGGFGVKPHTDHSFLIAPDGKILWEGHHETLRAATIAKLIDEYTPEGILNDRVVSMSRSNIPPKYIRSRGLTFSVKEIKEETAPKLGAFTNSLGYHVVTDSLSNILKMLMDEPPFLVDTQELVYNPILEVKIIGYRLNPPVLRDLLCEMHEVELLARPYEREALLRDYGIELDDVPAPVTIVVLKSRIY